MHIHGLRIQHASNFVEIKIKFKKKKHSSMI
jgi:hypothetical protein